MDIPLVRIPCKIATSLAMIMVCAYVVIIFLLMQHFTSWIIRPLLEVVPVSYDPPVRL